MKRRTILLSILLYMAIVAAGVILPTRRTLNVSPVTLSSQPVDVPRLEQSSASNPTGGPVALLAVTEKGVGLQARPVDPTTLADLPGYAPISFGHHYIYAASPDRKTLAVLTWPSGSNNAGGALHLIDLDTWTDMPADLRIDDYVSELTFDTDGKTLYWTSPTAHDPAHGIPRAYQLYRYDLDSHRSSAITPFPSSFMPWFQRLSSGKVAIFGIFTDPNDLAQDVPHVLIVDPERNRMAADVRLDGVQAGQFREPATNVTPSAQEETWQYVMYRPGLAWDLERNLLYVVHADDNKVTMVDLVNGAVMQQTYIHPQHSVLEWLLAVPSVEAKGGPVTEARAVLSRDGKRLYVFSQQTEDGLLSMTNLRVIATDGMREISRLDDLLTDFALTPDGQSVLVVKGEIVRPYGFDMMVNRDIYVLDAETLRERAHVRADQADQLWFEGSSPDGRYVYVNGASARWVEGNGWRDWRTTRQLLDLNPYRLVLADESKGGYAALLHILP
jgi:hypothetical protein